MAPTAGTPETFVCQAAKDRYIAQFPLPQDESPYNAGDFSDCVQKACRESHSSTVRTAKAIFVGDVAVGKTSLIHRFCHNVFDMNYKATIGVDFEVENFDILGSQFTLQIWDTAGQERFKCIAAAYYRGTHSIVVVFDMNDPATLEGCHEWMREALKQQNMTKAEPLKFLVGTKMDTVPKDSAHFQAMRVAARSAAREMGAELWFLSSKTGSHVNDFFFRLSALIMDNLIGEELQPTRKIDVGLSLVKKDSQQKEKPKCCK